MMKRDRRYRLKIEFRRWRQWLWTVFQWFRRKMRRKQRCKARWRRCKRCRWGPTSPRRSWRCRSAAGWTLTFSSLELCTRAPRSSRLMFLSAWRLLWELLTYLKIFNTFNTFNTFSKIFSSLRSTLEIMTFSKKKKSINHNCEQKRISVPILPRFIYFLF